MTIQISIPQVDLVVGTRVFNAPADSSAGATRVKISFDKSLWPNTGGQPIFINLYCSIDSGQNFFHLVGCDWTDTPEAWVAKGVPFSIGYLATDLPFPQLATRRLKAEVITSKPVTLLNVNLDVS